MFGQIEADGEADGRRSGIAEAETPRSEIDFYASRLPSAGTDVGREHKPLFLLEPDAGDALL